MSNKSGNKSKPSTPALTSLSSSGRMDTIQDDAVPMPSLAEADTSKPRGYPHAILNGKADEKFCCSYCKYILRDPVQSSCGHRFCQECLKMMETLRPQPLQCQSCVEEGITDEDSYLDPTDVFEDKAARREMKKLQVKCMYQGCSWKGFFNDFMIHEEECDKKMVVCSQCGANVSKARLANHEAKSCPKRVINCQYCQEPVTFENREKHNENCQKYLVKCDRCQTPVERYKLLTHQETLCINRTLICPLPDCDVEAPMDKFIQHMGKEMPRHVTYLLDKSQVVEQRLQTLENRLQDSSSSPHYNVDPASSSIPPSHASSSSSSSSFHPHHPPPLIPPSSSASGGAQASAGFAPPVTGGHGEGAQAEGEGGGDGGLIHEDRQKLQLHEDLMSVLHSEILRCITKGEALGRSMDKSDNRLRDCYASIESITARVSALEAKVAHDPSQYGELLTEAPGRVTWVIKGYSNVKREAVQRDKEVICSPSFLSYPGGYQLRLKLYANGEVNQNRNRNVSLYFQIVQGPNDGLLVWPFTPKVHFMLVDQGGFREHHVKTYEVDPMSPASRRPTEDVSIAAGCPAFISLHDMEQKMPLYYPKDTLYLKVCVEMPAPCRDRINALNPLNYTSSSLSSPSSPSSSSNASSTPASMTPSSMSSVKS